MHLALILIGALFGVLIKALAGGSSSAWFPAAVGAFVGYAVAELYTLRLRGDALERELAVLRERLAAMQRRHQADSAPTSDSAQATTSASSHARAAPPEVAATPVRETVRLAQPGPSGLARSARVAPASEPSAAGTETSGAFEPDAAAAREKSAHADSHAAEARAESPVLRVVREYLTGGNTLVRVGVLILFFGVAFLLRYIAEHSHVPVQFRLSGVACGGVALLALGWRLRAKRAGYALAVQGGGLGILYLTAFAALRLYSIVSAPTVFAILVSLAVISAILAVLQDSQAFALLAITGGFLAPILASTGAGSHVILFGYYAVLNASILTIAWYKAWQPLNLAGFAFTFVISAIWGALHYESELFASTEPFLALFWVFYVAIAILFSVRQPPNLRGYVDGTLVFGTPIAAFGYQSGMLHDRPVALAVSAAVVGTAYLVLAWVLRLRRRNSQRLLSEAFIALGVVFFTVATPLALDGTQTGVTWGLEGAGLVWIGVRQQRVVPRVFGPLLQIIAAMIQISDVDGFFVTSAPPLGLYLARAVTAVAAVASAVMLRKYAARLRPFEVFSAPVMFFLGLAQWVFCGLVEISGYVPHGYDTLAALVFVAATALICSELSRRTALSFARLPALWLLPALVLFAAASAVPPARHPFDFGGWLAWPLSFAAFYVVCRRHEGQVGGRLANFLHVTSTWLVVALLSWQVAWYVARGVSGHGSWPAMGWMLVPAAALFWLPRLSARVSWPFGLHREAYRALAGAGLALYLALWSFATNVSLSGDPYPFPYLPLFNALDLAQVLALAVLARFCVQLKSNPYPGYRGSSAAPVIALASLFFIWLNAALIRTVHRWGGVPFDLDSVIRSTLVQTSLSIFWTVLALATMLIATRRVGRTAWITGACLLAVTIGKLFVVDLSHAGTIERIVSFVGVGLLTLVIGYFSPLPPAANSHRTTLS
jgi:uncharacterized membrane protein